MPTVYIPPPYGLKLKISRARKHLRHLRRIVERFKASNPYTFRREVDADGVYYLYSLNIVEAPPITEVLTDEAIHHLRTILDHLVCALVESAGKKVTHSHAFPVLRTEPKTPCEIARYDVMLKDVPTTARALIDLLQPYQRGTDAKNDPLAILARLDNRFKHVSMHLFSHQVRIPSVPGIIQPPQPARRRYSGDIFAKVPIGINVKQDFEPYISVDIAFGVDVTGLPGIDLDRLDAIYNHVRDEVLHKFVRLKGISRRL